jgi:hypothetical protein
VSGSDDALRLFLNGFTARDIAGALPSVDDAAPVATIRAAMDSHGLDVVGVRKLGVITGWLTRNDLDGDQGICRPIDLEAVIADTASLNDVIQKLNPDSCLFVRSLGEVSGVVRASDLQKAPMRMWLFGLVTITELRVTRMIDEVCPGDSWREYLSEGRLQLAAALQQERRRRRQQPSLLDCLQLADKGRIVARNEALRRRTQFASRRAVEDFVNALQDLRNNLAHAQDISGDWDIIRDLATNVHRVVLGPPMES